MTAFLTQTRTELPLSLRQGEQLLVSFGIPLLVLVFFSLVDVLPMPAGVDDAVDFLAPGVLALAVMSTAMVSLGIGTGFERQYGVLKRLGTTPLGPTAIDRGQGHHGSRHRGRPGDRAGRPPRLLLGLERRAALGRRRRARCLLGTAAFAGIGLLMAGTAAGNGDARLANGLYLVLLLLGGMIIPLEKLPGARALRCRAVARRPAGRELTAALTAVRRAGAKAWVVLIVWAVAAPILAAGRRSAGSDRR